MIHKTLTIAGFDSSGGAGLQADLKTFAAFGCYGMSILTALPIQNTCGVRNCYQIPIHAIQEQFEVIFDDLIPDAIKIGMLFNSEIINLVAGYIKSKNLSTPIVLDPVIMSKSGYNLLLPKAIDHLKFRLIPLVTLITPNIPEAEVISNYKIKNKFDMIEAGKIILAMGAKAVLIKGGHLLGNVCDDLLISGGSQQWFRSSRVDTKNTHGTGCTLSAAITACLAQNIDLWSSCKIAKTYITNALLAYKNEKIGKQYGPVHHFYHLWPTIQLLETE